MNKATPHIDPDDDIGPLDEHGQQIWSPEEEAAIERVIGTPEYRAAVAEAEADIAAGHVHTNEEAVAHMEQVRTRFLADRRP